MSNNRLPKYWWIRVGLMFFSFVLSVWAMHSLRVQKRVVEVDRSARIQFESRAEK